MSRYWLAAYCYPKCEFRAEAAIQNIGYSVFLPRERRWVSHARYKQEVERPLFPRYLFVNLHQNDPWPQINQADGVANVLCCDGVPMRAEGDKIAAIKAAQMVGGFDETASIGRLAKGELVRVVAGPFAGFIAEICAADSSRKRADILVSLLGKQHSLRVEFSKLRVTAVVA